jgi:DNA polymerase III sliding clamp (beta) subunit (PCNA family)
VEGGVNKFTSNSNDFKSMLKKLSISLPSKGRSQGIEVLIKDNTISGMATDGNSLAYYKTDYQVLMPSYENTQITFRIALPTVLVEKIRTLHMDKTFVLSIDDRHLTIDTGKIQITAQKADDTIFPDCAELLTTQFTDLATIETKKFLSIVNPILTHIKVDIPHAPMMTIENDLMKFDIADKNGKGATCTLPCDYNGEKICIGFNPELILSYAKVLDDSSKYFAMHFDINDVACTVCKLTDGTDFIYFAMPCEIYNR